MKIPPLCLAPLRRGAGFGLIVALTLGSAKCSNTEPPVTELQPSVPGGPAAPVPLAGEPAAPGGSAGPSGPEPLSTPEENDGPGATETNFLTPPCREDGDCPGGRRCIIEARTAGEPDAGGADAGDAGPASDAGLQLGFCELPDAG